MRLGKKRWMGIAFGATIFLVAFGLALTQQLFQVSRTVPAELAVFDTAVLPDEQLDIQFRNGNEVGGLRFTRFQIQPPLRQFDEGEAATRRIFITNRTTPQIRLFVSDPCHPAVDANTGQEVGFFHADLHGGNVWWDEQAGRWNDDDAEWAGGTCDNERPPLRLMPDQTFTMDIRLKLHEQYQNIDPQTINLEPVVIGGVGREVPPEGQIHGAKYWDQNGNGQWDDGEPGLRSWIIVLDIGDDGSFDMKTVTDGGGNYWFMNVPEGNFGLTEEPVPGWLPTQPPGDAAGNPGAYHDYLGRNEVGEGFDFGNQLVAAEIHGVKFNDRNNNGQWDEGEEGLPGWEIAIDLDGDTVADRIVTTNRKGEYWFMDLPAGAFEIWEVLQPGWVQTYPVGNHTGSIAVGEIQHFNFGNNLEAAEIHGRKFRDLNGDGAWQEGEPFLPGWTIYLDLDGDGIEEQTEVTNEFGAYWFMNLPSGPYHVWEEDRPGWTQTLPAPGGYFGELAVGDILRRKHFGNELTSAQIHGRKYNDLNDDGQWQEGEPFLAGWEIILDMGQDGSVDYSATTDENGAYWFMNLPNGLFSLEEKQQAHWVVTEPAGGAYTGELNAGDVLRGMLFGNNQLPSVSFSVDSRDLLGWQDTGVDVIVGDVITITA